ncbi:MAG: TerD family protein [Oligoflexales bacterium]
MKNIQIFLLQIGIQIFFIDPCFSALKADNSSQTSEGLLEFEIPKSIEFLYFSVHWLPTEEAIDIDVDLNIHVVKKNKKITHNVYYLNRHYHRYIMLKDDDLTGENFGETSGINIEKLLHKRPNISNLIFSITVYSGHKISSIQGLYFKAYTIDESNGQESELFRFKLDNSYEKRGVVVANLRKQDDTWLLSKVSRPFDGPRETIHLDAIDSFPIIEKWIKLGVL